MSSPAQESDSCDSPQKTGRKNEPDDNTSSESSDSDNRSDRPKNRPPTLVIRMLNLCKEITIMVLLAVVYAALTNDSPPKVSKSPAAYPFFPRNSLVTDWYRGQIIEAIEEARSSDIAFVMFYAPWDAESQNARKQFELAAEFMHETVTFAGINCWQPGSECKRQYSKVYKWPVLIAYPTHGRGIQYNGPLEAFHMIRFLQNICKPLLRPYKIEDLYGKHDIIVTGNINFLPGSNEYAVFYSTALRFLERDPFRDIVFAVLPQKYNSSASIHLHHWNGTIEYDGEWNPETLINWISKNLRQIVIWLAPTGMKSLTMSSFIQQGPTLILFTPKNPLHQTVDLYDMLREIAYEYHNCANDTKLVTRRKQIRTERLKNRQNYEQLKRKCLQEKPKDIVTSLPNIWSNNTLEDICNCVNTEWNKMCQDEHQLQMIDKMSTEFLQKTVTETECRLFLLAHKYSPVMFERNAEEKINVRGLACKTNLTLTFVALDSSRFYHFAEKLGVGLVDGSGAAIVDEKMETHYVLEDELNGVNLRFFVRNFTHRTLSRSLCSRARLKLKNQHVYPHLSCGKFEHLFCVQELTSSNFLDVVLKRNEVVVVFYYSKQCAFCSGISYVFLTVSKMLSPVKEVTFARIDGDINLLPWEYTMETYPTILFTPARRKSESRIFPKNLRVTVPNLLGFILTNVEPVLKLKTMWFLCRQVKFVDEKMKCITSIRIETLNVINKTLKEWRVSKRKQKVLHQLQTLRHLHLLLAHSPDRIADVETNLRKLRD